MYLILNQEKILKIKSIQAQINLVRSKLSMPSENTIYLAAIIFVSALLGYLYFKFIDKDDEDLKISPEYLTGLKFLLNEQADKAINLFSKIVQVDEETIETHLALGVLFRKQGKIDQAIKTYMKILFLKKN